MFSIASAAYTQEYGRALPGFGYRRFLETVKTGLEEKHRVEANRKVAEENAVKERRLVAEKAERKLIALENWRRRWLRETLRLENTYQNYQDEKQRWEKSREEMQEIKRRQDSKDMWTTMDLRPLAEPPIVDWENFLRWYMPSKLRFRALFPDEKEKEKRARMMDLVGERNMLLEYMDATVCQADDLETDQPRKDFWRELREELMADYEAVHKESAALWATATELGKFEHRNLDEDGKTTRLEEALARGTNIFHMFGEEVRRKYGYLVPDDFVERPLATFEWQWLDIHGSPARLEQLLREGHEELLDYFSEREIGQKYGHLLQCYGMGGQEPVLEQWHAPPMRPWKLEQLVKEEVETVPMPPLWELVRMLLTANAVVKAPKSAPDRDQLYQLPDITLARKAGGRRASM